MANIKITDLDAYADPKSTDVLPAVDVTNDETKKVSIADLMENAGSGTEAAPGIAFDGDPNTGIYRPGADQLAISTAGTQRLLISDTGAVTIPGDLTVQGTTTTIDTTNLIVEDKNIEMGSVTTPTDTTADGGGITLKGATDKTINWVNATDAWTSSERFDFPAGTAAAPSIILNGDVNSGIYQPGADQVAISTGGSGRLFVDANGRAGLTLAPSAAIGAHLQVGYGSVGSDHVSYNYDSYFANNLFKTGSNAWSRISSRGGGLLRIEDQTLTYSAANSGTAGSSVTLSEHLRITSDGKVGIGSTTDPGSYNARLWIDSTADTTFTVNTTGSTNISQLVFRNSNVNGEARLLNGTGGPLTFFRSFGNEAARIDTSGRVGVGTTNPSYLLQVAGGTSGSQFAIGDSSPRLVLDYRAPTTSTAAPTITSDGVSLYYYGKNGSTGAHVFHSGTSNSEALRIDNSGRLGLGTSSPSAKLQVENGDIYIGTNGNYLRGKDGNSDFKILLGYSAAQTVRLGEFCYLDTANQRLGIGTTSPQSPLTIGATSDFGAVLCISRTDTNYNSGMLVLGNGNSTDKYVAVWRGAANSVSSGGEYLNLGGYDGISFATGAAAIGSQSERARIDSSGRVGIGTTNPSYQLHVDGEVLFRGTGNTNGSLRIRPNGTAVYSQIFFDNATATSSAQIICYGGTSLYVDSASNGDIYHRTNGTGAHVWTVNSGASEAARIDSSGRVGLGTSTPASSLNFGDAAANSGIQFGDSADFTIKRNTTDTTIDFNVGSDLNHFQWKVGGINYMRLDSSGRLGIGTTSPASKLTITETANANGIEIRTADSNFSQLALGINTSINAAYLQSSASGSGTARDLAFYGNSGEWARFDTSGRLLVGTTTTSGSALLQVQGRSGATTDYAVFALRRGSLPSGDGQALGAINFSDNSENLGAQIYATSDAGSWTSGSNHRSRLVFSTTADGASSPTERMTIKNDGNVIIPAVYSSTTATAANVNVNTDGYLIRSVSSIKYKTNVETLQDSYADSILNCRPVWYQSTSDYDNKEWGYWGFIAEEVAEIDPRLCLFAKNEDGGLEPEGVQYDRFVPHLLNLLKRQKEQIEAMEARLSALEAQ